jgi:hypothetical protein
MLQSGIEQFLLQILCAFDLIVSGPPCKIGFVVPLASKQPTPSIADRHGCLPSEF